MANGVIKMSKLLADPELMTRPQAAELLGIRAQTLAAWASTRRYDIPFIKVGRAVRYRRADLFRWLQRRTIGPSNSQTSSDLPNTEARLAGT
jgi:excisionase family DNA binding protein